MSASAQFFYQKADGSLIARCDRFERGDGKKDFYWYLAEGTGFTKGLKGLPVASMPLYHLPDVLRVAAAGGVAWVVEGEGKCDVLAEQLRAHGVADAVVTTIAGGAKTDVQRHHLDSLRGFRSVVVLMDSDPPDKPGRAAGRQRAKAVAGVVNLTSVVDLFPDRNDCSDVADWFEEGRTIQDLLEYVYEHIYDIPVDCAAAPPKDDGPKMGRSADEIIELVAAMEDVEYERNRVDLAKEANVRATFLDDKRKERRKTNKLLEGLQEEFRAAHCGPVSLPVTLEDVRRFIRRFIVLSDHQADTLALWIAHTHAIDAADVTPYLNIWSLAKRCGKTRLLEVLKLLVRRPWKTGRVSAAVLPRKIERVMPTLLLDESDAAFNGPKDYVEALRGVFNDGFERDGKTSLCVGKDHEDHDFSVFCCKAIAGIGRHLPDTIADRSIQILLERKTGSEKVEKFRRRSAKAEAEPLHAALVAWAKDAIPGQRARIESFDAENPCLPDDVNDRAQDMWEPLVAIADEAEWGKRAKDAAIALSGDGTVEDDSQNVSLLADIKLAFDGRPADSADPDDAGEPPARVQRAASGPAIESKDLAAYLAAREGSPWASRKGEPPFGPTQLAALVKRHHDAFGRPIHPKPIWVGKVKIRGYLRAWFIDLWDRYLPKRRKSEFEPGRDGGTFTGQGFAPDSEPGMDDSPTGSEKSRKAASDKNSSVPSDPEGEKTENTGSETSTAGSELVRPNGKAVLLTMPITARPGPHEVPDDYQDLITYAREKLKLPGAPPELASKSEAPKTEPGMSAEPRQCTRCYNHADVVRLSDGVCHLCIWWGRA